MKKLFTLSLLLVTINCYSQNFIGKTKDELKSSFNYFSKEIIFNNKPSIYIEVDSNISDIFSFNEKDVCVEYIRSYSNEEFDDIQNNFLKNFRKNGNLWVDDFNGLMAIIKTSKNFYQISIRRNKYY